MRACAVIGLIHGTHAAEGDLRAIYYEWWQGMQTSEQNRRLTRSKARYLVGTTRPRNVTRWEKMVQTLLQYEIKRLEKDKESALQEGEIRVEMMTVKLAKNGLARMGALNPDAAAGDGLIVLKVNIPGDATDITETYPMRRGIAKCNPQYQKRSPHEGSRRDELFDLLHSPDPEASNLSISLHLCNKNGAELTGADNFGATVPRSLIGVADLCLKDLIREEKAGDGGTVEIRGMLELNGILGLPKEVDKTKKKVKKSGSKKDVTAVESPGVDDDEPAEEESPVPLGEIRVRIAIRPPSSKSGMGAAPDIVVPVEDIGDGGGGAGAGGAGGSEEMPTDMLELARMALRRKSELAALPRKPPGLSDDGSRNDDGAGVGATGSGRASSKQESVEAAPSGAPSGNASPGPDGEGNPLGEMNEEMQVANMQGKVQGGTISKLMSQTMSKKDTVVYTVAYWIKWRPFDSVGDQMLFFGEPRNQPTLIRGSKLGALVDNQFCATEYDPRLAGDNWQLLVVTNNGLFSKFYIGFSSIDDSGQPTPARAQEPEPGRDPSDVRTEFNADVRIKRLKTTGKGAGLLAQAWIWPRDLEPDEVRELWIETKKRYPVAKRGLPTGGMRGLAYREAPSMAKKGDVGRPQSAGVKKDDKLPPIEGEGGKKKKKEEVQRELMPWEVYDPIIEKDTAQMLEIPLSAKLAFRKLVNVFTVLVDYTGYSGSFLVVDRMNNMSNTAELMLEVALRRNPTAAPTTLLMDSRKRLQDATIKLKQLIDCGFLIDEEKEYGANSKLLSQEFAMGADLRRLITKKGLHWLRATPSTLRAVEHMIGDMPMRVKEIYRQHGDEAELRRDGRPKLPLIWKNFYQAQLYASATHYIIFDEVEDKGRSVVPTLGSIGSIFMNGSTDTYDKIQECIEEGAPILLLESTGGVTQAFAYVMKAVRLLKPKWDVDFIMRLVTEYKTRAARDREGKITQEVSKKYILENIHLLDKELARIDLMLSDTEANEAWMENFGLPEILILYQNWQRAPDFVLRQLQTADVMKKNDEQLLDLYTGCFSSSGGIPELGLGNAEIKVVATAWNRHLLLYNNARIYNYRAWTMQFVLYYLGFMTTTLSILTNGTLLGDDYTIKQVMLIMPIVTALLETVNTRLRTQQKFSACKMASFMLVSEIYKFRVRAIEYDQASLSALLAELKNPSTDKKKDDNAIEVPISAKERDSFARKLFVERVSSIYTACMNTEMSKGTSITHKSRFGMDPARLLRSDDTGPDDSEKETRRLLMEHVANRLYFMTTLDWRLGVDAVNAQREAVSARRNKAIKRKVQAIGKSIVMLFASIIFKILELNIRITYYILGRLKGAATGGLALPAVPKPPSASTTDEEEGGGDGNDGTSAAQQRINQLKERWAKLFNLDAAMGSMADAIMESEDRGRGEKLDETYRDEESDDEADAAAADGAPKDTSKALGDDFFSSLTIDAYMQYRTKPVLAYLERTSPWRGFWMQLTEIGIFIFNSSGAVLVGMGKVYVPYVAMTVAAASILRSFLEFSKVGKQVEAYNLGINMIHSMLNDWDRMTRTERRTRQTIAKVVNAVEGALNLVAIALTDALPSGGDDEEAEGDEEKKEE